VGITDVTTAAAWIVGLAIVALIAAGWRKRARATADPARARLPSRAPVGIPMEEVHAPLYRPASIWRRVWSLGAGTVIAIVTGAVLATFLGFGLAFAVITLTEMLKKSPGRTSPRQVISPMRRPPSPLWTKAIRSRASWPSGRSTGSGC